MEVLLFIVIFNPIIVTLLVLALAAWLYPHPIEIVSTSYPGDGSNRADGLFCCR
jgi:hypothetical protein